MAGTIDKLKVVYGVIKTMGTKKFLAVISEELATNDGVLAIIANADAYLVKGAGTPAAAAADAAAGEADPYDPVNVASKNDKQVAKELKETFGDAFTKAAPAILRNALMVVYAVVSGKDETVKPDASAIAWLSTALGVEKTGGEKPAAFAQRVLNALAESLDESAPAEEPAEAPAEAPAEEPEEVEEAPAPAPAKKAAKKAAAAPAEEPAEEVDEDVAEFISDAFMKAARAHMAKNKASRDNIDDTVSEVIAILTDKVDASALDEFDAKVHAHLTALANDEGADDDDIVATFLAALAKDGGGFAAVNEAYYHGEIVCVNALPSVVLTPGLIEDAEVLTAEDGTVVELKDAYGDDEDMPIVSACGEHCFILTAQGVIPGTPGKKPAAKAPVKGRLARPGKK